MDWPLELFQSVIRTVYDSDDTHTIFSLLVVSRAISQETERVLYHSVTLDGSKPGKDFGFCVAVSTCKRLARNVHRLRLTFPPSSFLRLENKHLQRLESALLAIVNLRVLQSDVHFIPPPPSECAFQLEEFKWGMVSADHDVGAFLARQTKLRRLEVTWGRNSLPLPHTACPNLSILIGPTAALRTILPGRSVRYIHWYKITDYDDTVTSKDTTAIAASLRRVRALVMSSLSNALPFLPFIEYLDELQYLELNGDASPHLESIQRLPELRGLLLWTYGQTLDAVAPLFKHVKTLRFVDYYDYASASFFRWDRDAGDCRLLPRQHDWLSDIA